jgi:hypothetical protein
MIEDWEAMYRALVRRLVEIADNPSATERMVDYGVVARTHERIVFDQGAGPIDE